MALVTLVTLPEDGGFAQCADDDGVEDDETGCWQEAVDGSVHPGPVVADKHRAPATPCVTHELLSRVAPHQLTNHHVMAVQQH